MNNPAAKNLVAPDNHQALDSRDLVKMHMEDASHVFTDDEISRVEVSSDHIDISEHPLIKALDGDDDDEPKGI